MTANKKIQVKKVTTKDISSVRYLNKENGFSAMIYVTKDGAKGEIEFKGFPTKEEAQQFFKQLKQAKNYS